MRNKMPFFLILVLSLLTVFVFNSQANAQRSCDDEISNKRNREAYKVRRTPKPARTSTVVVASGSKIFATDSFYKSNNYIRNDRFYENEYSSNIAEIARLNGYEDGLYEGAKDARDGDRYDPFGEHDYKDADDGYKSRYGYKARYKQIYRQAFIRGYREAFDRYLGSRSFNW